ncbi:MAG: hypothetical protein JXN64_14975 [Spirochaetes bacterium]|nr:hypothetical protein [Spirochaetota bacterium]
MIRYIKLLSIALIFFVLLINISPAQQTKKPESTGTEKTGRTESIDEDLIEEGKKLDEEIFLIYKKINDVIVNYKLSQLKDIKFLPYRTTYDVKDNYIQVEKYEIERDYFNHEIIRGINKKIIKLFLSGNTISRVESEITEQMVGAGYIDRVIVIDPSPLVQGTDDITFTQTKKTMKILDNKKLGDIKNDASSPVRNNIKKEFIIPHITSLFDTLLSIADSYYKGIKDTDSILSDFLKKSADY